MELARQSLLPSIPTSKKHTSIQSSLYSYFVPLFWGSIFLASATIDIPTSFRWGQVSGSAAASVLFACIAWLLWLITPILTRTLVSAVVPYVFFLFWVFFSNMWGPLTLKGIQNQVVWFGFVGLIILSGYTSYRYPKVCQNYVHIIGIAAFIATGLFFTGYLSSLNGWPIPISVGYRQFALFMLIPLAWYLVSWQLGTFSSFGVALFILASIVLSLSRMAFLSAGVLFFLSMVISKPKHVVPRLIFASVLGLGLIFVLFTQFAPLANRDMQFTDYSELWFRIGNIQIYGSGRVKMWSVTIESIGQSPWIGQGAGSASGVVLLATGWLEHPHNDYLRILHDYGVIGLSLFLVALASTLRELWQNWRKSTMKTKGYTTKHIYGSTFLLLIAFALSMITDNIVAYYFLMFPLGILIGTSAGLVSYERKLNMSQVIQEYTAC
jgi:O-antigen ligase